MLQQIETIYLAILRVVVIVIAGLLLVSVVIYGLNSFQGLSEPKPDTTPPAITSESLTRELTETTTGADNTPELRDDAEAEQKADLAKNGIHYSRAAEAIARFVEKQSGGEELVIKQKVEEVIKENAESQPTPELATAYAKGFADAIEGTLANPSIANLAQQTGAIEVVNKALNAYSQSFHDQLAEKERKFVEEQQERLEKQAGAMMSLYIAAGAFGMFLLVVFLSIFIRIERHLRHLDGRPLTQNG